jgi:hypothetical protein
MLLSLNPRISIDPHAPPHQQHQQAQHHHHQAHQSHHRHEFFAQPSPLTPFGMHIHAGVGSDEQPRSAVAVSPACATPATPFAPPTTAAAAAAVAAFNLTVTAPHRALSTQFQQLNSNSSSSSRLQAPRPHRAAPIMASLVHLSSSPVQLFGSSPRPMHFSRSPSPPQLQTPMLSPNPLLTLPTTVGVSHGQRSPGNNCSILDGHQGRAAQFTPRVGGLLYCDEQIDAFVTAHDGGLASSPCIGQHGAAATAAAVAGSTPVSTTMQPQQQVPVLMRRTTSTRDEDSATSSSSAEVQASKQQTPARHDPTGTIAVDDIVQAPAPLSAAEIRTQEVAARMRGWWSTLGRYPALDAQTREHIRLLDSVMESACKEVMAWSGGGSGSEVGSGGIGSLQHQHYQQDPCPLEVAELSELMERVSSSFCTTGEKVVEHFVRIAQQCDEQQAALYDAANSGYLLYDTGSTTSSNGSNSSKSSGRGSSATKAKLSIHEPMRRRSKIPRTGMRSSPKSVAALDNAETSSDDDDDEEGQPAIVVVASSNNTRHRPKGVLLAKKPVTAAAAALTAVGGDSSSESDQETSRKRKQPASSTKRAKRAATEVSGHKATHPQGRKESHFKGSRGYVAIDQPCLFVFVLHWMVLLLRPSQTPLFACCVAGCKLIWTILTRTQCKRPHWPLKPTSAMNKCKSVHHFIVLTFACHVAARWGCMLILFFLCVFVLFSIGSSTRACVPGVRCCVSAPSAWRLLGLLQRNKRKMAGTTAEWMMRTTTVAHTLAASPRIWRICPPRRPA